MEPYEFEFEERLADFSAFIRCMDRETLLLFRERCASMHPGTKERETVLEVIDGQLALRDLYRNSGSQQRGSRPVHP